MAADAILMRIIFICDVTKRRGARLPGGEEAGRDCPIPMENNFLYFPAGQSAGF
jgi:hypothetical protein